MVKLLALRALRERAALSQRELAQRAGTTQTTISRLEQGYDARPTTTRRLARALRVQPADLMGPMAEGERP